MAGPTRPTRSNPPAEPFGPPRPGFGDPGGDPGGDPWGPADDFFGDRPPRRPGGRSGDGAGPGGPGGPRGRGPGPGGNRPRRRSFVWRWRRAFFLLALMGLAAVAAAGAVVAQTELPEINELAQSTFICDATVPDDQPCTAQNAMAKIQGGEDRVNVRYEDLSPHVINAVVAMEDRNFFEHDGVAPLAIGRALYRDLRGDAVQQGGSTITQQYVKNAFLSPERAITRKITEAVLSIKLEQRLSKEEILEGYLNTIYFGRGAYGVQAASQAYFGVDVGALEIHQAAYLAGLIRAPSLADATEHPEEAERRRSTALVAMEEEGYISEDELAFADAVPFAEPHFRPLVPQSTFQQLQGGDKGTAYVTAYVAELLQREPYNLDEQDVLGGGLRVHTSLDMTMQTQAWDAVTGVLGQPEDPAAALVAVDDQGLIRAMVGGPDFAASPNNYAVRGMGVSGRPVGSTFKPIALAEAVASNYALSSRYDAPAEKPIDQTALPECTEEWTPHNYAESEQGNLDLVEATAQSSNTAYGQMMIDLTPAKVTEMATALGMPGEFPVQCGPIVLGTDNASPLDMATVYSTFANRGVRKDPQIITKVERVNAEGHATTLYQWRPPQGQRVLTEEDADLVNHALQQVLQDGTGTVANIGKPAAGKTGTTSDNKDAWFVGYVPRLTAAVWMGYPNADWDDPETPEVTEVLAPMSQRGRPVHGLASVTGGSLPAQIWHDFMLAVTDSRGMADEFQPVTPEQLSTGQQLGIGSGAGGGGDDGQGNGNGNGNGQPDPSDPGTTVPGQQPPTTRPGQGNTTTTPPSTTTTTEPTTTSTTSTTTTTLVPWPPPRPGGGND